MVLEIFIEALHNREKIFKCCLLLSSDIKMSLTKFFRNGNKLGVIGSVAYMAESASDLDFVLFTNDGTLGIPSSPAYSHDFIKFFESEFQRTDLDFSGSKDGGKGPYNLSELPTDDIRLDGYLLTGMFYPDNDFLEEHYKNVYGSDFLAEAWLRFSRHVQGFPSQELRLNKRHKDLPLLMRAAETLANSGHSNLRDVIDKYRNQYHETNELYRHNKMNIIEYYDRTSEMVPGFVEEVNSLL